MEGKSRFSRSASQGGAFQSSKEWRRTMSSFMTRLDLFRRQAQIVSRHFFRLRNAQHSEYGRRNIPQRPAWLQREVFAVCGDHDKRDGICSVGGMWTAGRGIDDHLGVAVIGGDQERAPLGTDYRFDAPQTTVHRFDGFDGG